MSDRSVNSRSRWLVHGSAAVLAAALSMAAHSEASAQAIGPRIDAARAAQADVAIASGGVTVVRGAVEDTILIDGPAAILNWSPLDTATIDTTTDFINFLPQNTALTFEGTQPNFTVLNRIVPTANGAGQFRGVAISGAVSSNAGSPVTNGNIWFYSPGGVLIGSGASFNVGSLVLTTSDIQTISGGPQIDFTGVADSMSAVTIQQGATITVPEEGGSAIFLAPTINQAGTVDVNGSVLYMSAEEGSVFNNGTDGLNFFTALGGEAGAGNGISHTGTTTGPASIGSFTVPDIHVIDFFAPGANLNILISGSLGYQPATIASQSDNGTIRLGSGLDAAGSLELGSLNLTSSAAFEAGSIDLSIGNGDTFQAEGDPRSDYDVTLTSNDTLIDVGPGGVIDILGNLTADRAIADGGELNVSVTGGGQLTVGANFAGLFGVDSFQSGNDPEPLSAGAISFDISDGGLVNIGENFDLIASFQSGERFSNLGQFVLLDAVGGEISLTMSGATSELNVGTEIFLDVSAASFASSVELGSSSTGGTGIIDIASGTVSAEGLSVSASAIATAGSADLTPQDGTGGTAIINLGDADVDASNIFASARGQGGFALQDVDGGVGQGGTARVTKGAGGIVNAGFITVDANGEGGGGGGSSVGLSGTSGGDGIGGTAELIYDQNPIAVFQLAISADGSGGAGGFSGAGQAGGTGGRGVGGNGLIQVDADGIVFELISDTFFSADGIGGNGGFGGGGAVGVAAGDGGLGGEGVGGTATLDIGGDSAFYTFNGNLFPRATGRGGNGGVGGANNDGGAAGAGGAGGDGTTGVSRVIARDSGEITFNGTSGSFGARAFGGDGGFGGAIALGSGGTPGTGGQGGVGTGGTFVFSAIGGSFTGGAGTVELSSEGQGGDGGRGGGNGEFGTVVTGAGPEGDGGNGVGGDVLLEILAGSDGSFTFDDLTLVSIGESGTGAVPGQNTGGTVFLSNAGTDPLGGFNVNSLTATAVDTVGAGEPSFVATSTSGPINIANDLTVNVTGDAVFNFAGNGQLVVGGDVDVNSQSDILITHTGNSNFVESIQSDGSIVMTAGNDFNAGADTLLSAVTDVDILASGIAYGFISAGQSAVLDSLSGIGGGAIDAGVDISLFAPAGVNVDDLTAGDIVLIDAGDIAVGDVFGSTIDFTTGQDILLDSIVADNGPVTLSALTGTVGTNINGPGSIEAASNIDIDAVNIDVGDLLARGDFDAGQIALDATGNVGIGDADALGTLLINAGGDASFGELLSRELNVGVVAGGSISGGGASAIFTDGTLTSQTISLDAGGDITLTDAIVSEDAVSLSAAGGISVGDVTGGTSNGAINIVASGGDVQTGNLTGGTQFTRVEGNSVTVGGLDVSALTLLANDGSIAALGTNTVAGTATLTATQDVSLSSLIAQGPLTVTASGLIGFAEIGASTGNLVVDTDGAVEGVGPGDVTGAENVTLSGASIAVGDVTAGDTLDINAVGAGSDLAFATLTAENRLEIDAGNDITGGAVTSNTQDIVARAQNVLDIETITSAQQSSTIFGGAGVSVSTITASTALGTTRVSSTTGDVTLGSFTGNAGNVTAGGAIRIEEDAAFTNVLQLEGTSIFLRTASALDVGSTANAGSIDIASTNDLNIRGATATGGSVTLSGNNSLTINSAIDAASGVELETFGLLTVDASVVGEGITVFADDIVITADGSIGDASRTFAIDFETEGNARFGGLNSGGGGDFEIDNDELTRISSGGFLSVSALAVSPGDTPLLSVLDANLTAGNNAGNFGQGSALELISDGSISVRGNLSVTGAVVDTEVALDALNVVNIDLGGGGVFVADANGALAGEVIVSATDFRALSDGVGPEIANASVAEIDVILSDNRGVNRPDGVITADTLTVATTGSEVYIQNTAPGTEFEERRGFTVNNLNISTAGGDPQPIVINGIVAGLTGVEAIAPTNITSTPAAGSTINGCALLNTAACTGVTPTPTPTPTPPIVAPNPDPTPDPTPQGEIPVRDVIEEEVRDPEEEEGIESGALDRPLIDLQELADPAGAPLIDDPVTGAGNEDLWEPAE